MMPMRDDQNALALSHSQAGLTRRSVQHKSIGWIPALGAGCWRMERRLLSAGPLAEGSGPQGCGWVASDLADGSQAAGLDRELSMQVLAIGVLCYLSCFACISDFQGAEILVCYCCLTFGMLDKSLIPNQTLIQFCIPLWVLPVGKDCMDHVYRQCYYSLIYA